MSRLIIGVGFQEHASAGSIADAIEMVLQAQPDHDVIAIAVPTDKARSAALLTTAGQRGWPVMAIDAAALRAADPQVITRSAVSMAQRGVGSVCEAAALAGAGRGAQLVACRVISADRRATAAAACTNYQEPLP